MTVVLDSSALITLAEDHQDGVDWVHSVMESEACFVAAPSLVEMYFTVCHHRGAQQAEHWLSFVEGPDFRVVDLIQPELIVLAAQALLLEPKLSESAAFGAALAHQMGVELVSTSPRFKALARAGFCRVATPPLER